MAAGSLPTPPKSRRHAARAKVASSMTGVSKRSSCGRTAMGQIVAATPKMSAMLQMLEPTALPALTSPTPLRAASMLTTSSGALVAKATRVRPMTMGRIFSAAAMKTPPLTRKSAP